MNSVGNAFCNRWRGHNRGKRATISNTFGHGDNVRRDVLGFKSPEVCARSAKASLHFVSDAQATRGAHMFVRIFRIAIWQHHRAAHALNTLCNERAHLSRRSKLNQTLHIKRVLAASIGVVGTKLSTVGVRHHRVLHAKSVGHIELPCVVRSERHGAGTSAVIGVSQGNDVIIARRGACHGDGQVVGFGTGVHEVAHL